jgi:hypothetical protein
MKFNHISKCHMWLKIDGALRGWYAITILMKTKQVF